MVSDQELVKIEAKKARERNIKDFPDLEGSILRDYPLEEEFTTKLLPKWFTVPKGYHVTNLRWGGSANKPRTKNPGLRFIWGLYGLIKSSYVVNTQLQTQDLRMQQVTTQDGVDLPAVNAILNYRVLNPLKAMTAVDDYRETTFAIAMARVRNTVSNHTLKDFLDTEDIQEKNLAINGEGKYQFKELEDIGTKNGRPIYYKS